MRSKSYNSGLDKIKQEQKEEKKSKQEHFK